MSRLFVSNALLAAIISPKLGILSDRIGRCYVLAICALGPILSNLVLIILARSSAAMAYRWFWLAAVFDGLTGAVAAIMATSHAYATDCTAAERRATVFGLLHACMFIGFAIGPSLGGYLIQVTDSILSVFYAGIIGQVLFVTFALFFLPESVPMQHRLDAQEMHRVSTQFEAARQHQRTMREWIDHLNFLKPLAILWPRTSTDVRPSIRRNLGILASIDTMMVGAGAGSMMVFILYAEFTFAWSSVEAGYFMSLSGTVRAIVLTFILPLATRFLRSLDLNGVNHVGASYSDILLIRAALAIEVIAILGYMVSKTSLQFMLSGCLGSVGSIASPTLQSTLTKHVPKHSTGQLLGALSLLHCLCGIIAPTIFSSIYAYTVGWFSKAFFIMLIFVFCVSLMMSVFVRKNTKASLFVEETGDQWNSGVEGNGYELEYNSAHIH